MTQFYSIKDLQKAYETGWQEGQDRVEKNRRFSKELESYKEEPDDIISFPYNHFYFSPGSNLINLTGFYMVNNEDWFLIGDNGFYSTISIS